LDNVPPSQGAPSNIVIATKGIAILRCPDDNTVQPNTGNLSYVVNGGFALFTASGATWQITPTNPQPYSPATLNWILSGSTATTNVPVTQKLGVMFMTTLQGGFPWDVRTTPSSIFDGASSTLLLSENVLAGATTSGSPATGGYPTTWATPCPQTTMFVGSHDICSTGNAGATADCTTGFLASQLVNNQQVDGPGWQFANTNGNGENVNYGLNLTDEGSSPYTNTAHPAGFNTVFCDGSVKFLSATIDGTVYGKILTPAGSKLPAWCKQLPVNQDEFAQ
jgi:prepilin-type processing-associated H-X9-DG protein